MSEVTPDNLTDEQILGLRENGFYPADLVHYAWAALGSGPLIGSGFELWRYIPKSQARRFLADAINSRAKAVR